MVKILDKKTTKLNYTQLLIDPNQRNGIYKVALCMPLHNYPQFLVQLISLQYLCD